VWDMLSHTMALRRYSSLFSLMIPSPNLPIIYRQDYAALAKTILAKMRFCHGSALEQYWNTT
jgi:hypothetical protein